MSFTVVSREFYGNFTTIAPIEKRFVCVGRLCEQKGQLLLLEAFRRVVDRFGESRLDLVGDGELRPQIEAQCRRLGLENNVKITGWVSAEGVREHILKSRALVLPSFQEGLPVVLMEAMALRRPVISTFVAGIPELVTPETGWLVPAGSVEDLVDAMLTCLEASPEHLRQMGDAAYARVVARHAIDPQSEKLARLFLAPTAEREID